MEKKQIDELKTYMGSFQKGCETYLGPLCNPKKKRVLVIGSGWGTEIIWALSKGAKEVVGIDPSHRPTTPLDEYLDEHRIKKNYKIIKGTLDDIVEDYRGYFDLILSFNVFEHILDLDKVFAGMPAVLNQDGGRVAIFTDPLFYSSCGAHLNIAPWQHLWDDLNPNDFQRYQWVEYQSLNKMTVSSFLESIRKSGAIVLQFSLKTDRNINKYMMYSDKIAKKLSLSAFDLTIEGISVELFFPSK